MAESQYFDLYSKKENSRNEQQIGEEGLNLSIRRAEHRDINELAVISRTCYTYLLRWQGPYSHNRKRWRALLDTESCEAWVCLNHGEIIGYFTLILDRQRQEEVDGKPAHHGLFVRLYMLAASPKLFITIALRKLKQRIRRILRRLVGSSNNDETAPSETLRRLYERKVPWFGYVAVIPAMRGKNVATEMVKFCFQRVVELGHKEIWVYVERENVGAYRLIKKAGFEEVEGINHLLLKKQL